MTSTSNIRLFVSFGDKGAVFAGENIECTITFKNIAPVPGLSRSNTAHGHPNSGSLGRSSMSGGSMSLPNGLPERRSKNPPLQLSAADKARTSVMSPRLQGSASGSRGHRPSLSLSVPTRRSNSSPITTRGTSLSSGIPKLQPMTAAVTTKAGDGHKHKRSISIMSIGSDGGNGEVVTRSPGRRPGGPPHSRSASVSTQHLGAKRSPSIGTNGSAPHSATLPRRSQPSMAMHMAEDSLNSFSFPSTRRSPGTPRHAATGSFNKSFKFPATPTTPASATLPTIQAPRDPPKSSITSNPDSSLAPGVTNIDLASPIDSASNSEFEHVPPSRVLNAQILNDDTPRSSGEFYNLSNSTNETLLSDYDSKIRVRPARPPHSRRQSLLAISTTARAAETLMMGYVQVSGSFTIDGSLVQSSPFDEVKRRGVLGGQMGGGVVGVERPKNDTGLFGGFGWSNFGSSIGSGLTSGIGGLLGGNNMSSIAEMKNIASSKSIPILSTPQSILFVDLKLGPGESRAYSFSFPLPKDIPPSHRGKAIKIVYNIVIGTQRPGKGVQQPKVVEIPFRVFPHVRHNGILHTHDLMAPIILLQDKSKSACLDDKPSPEAPIKPSKSKKKIQESSLDDFLQYAEELLSHNSRQHSPGGMNGLLSPSISLSRRSSFVIPEEQSSKEAIDMAVLASSQRQGTSQMFEIARNGRRVASLSLARPAYKLGEAIIAVIDFSGAQIPCYHLHATLETHETVNPSLALRSVSSIHRVTRKIHATHSESCLFAKRVTFVPTIPISGTPEFSTSGISSSWALRLEFVTPSLPQLADGMGDEREDGLGEASDLLEQTHKDERGQLFTAVQHVVCDMFDCHIPVKVYANDIGSAPSISPAGGWPV